MRPPLLLALCLAAPAWADPPVHFGPHDVPTVFAIGKSDDGNQVQYGLRLDEACRPVGKEPVVGYWRLYDVGPAAPLLPLSWLDRTAYGIDRQQVWPKGPEGPAVVMAIRTATNRDITIHVSRGDDGRCQAEAHALLGGRPAVLRLIFVQLMGPFPSWVELRGTRLDGPGEIRERVVL